MSARDVWTCGDEYADKVAREILWLRESEQRAEHEVEGRVGGLIRALSLYMGADEARRALLAFVIEV